MRPARVRDESALELRTAIDALKPGDPVVLHVERRGERLYLPFTLE